MEGLRKILVLSDSDGTKSALKSFLSERFEVVCGQFFELEQFALEKQIYEYILVDYILINDFQIRKQSEEFYLRKLALLKEFFPDPRIVLMVGQREIRDAGELLKLGFHNILQIPFSKEVVIHRLKIEKERSKLIEVVKSSSQGPLSLKSVFETKNIKFKEEMTKLERVAKSRSTILITGESGTGKSLLAKYIHQLSGREQNNFVEVHCGAIPETLVESELFGHEKGAFTGAIKRKLGKFELADKGTIFLDEIGTVSKNVQVKLLQVLQERFVQRVGGDANIPLDIRVVAATNEQLNEAVKTGAFREDLYYRLNVFHVHVPPLRERKEDIAPLVHEIVKKFSSDSGGKIRGVSPEVLKIFLGYDWPGNVRELENILERACVLEETELIGVESIPLDLFAGVSEVREVSPLNDSSMELVEARRLASEAFERTYLTDLLIAHNGRVSAMARQAQVSTRQLHKLMAKHNIRSKQFSIKLKDE